MSNDLVVLERQFDPLLDKFTQVLAVPGVNLTAPRLVRSVLISCERTPKLLNCTRQSLFNAAMSAACLGLEVDGVTGQAFLIPFDVHGTPTAQLVVGYKGFNTLAARSGITITAEVVREGDAFDFDEGEGWVRHKKILGKPGRRMIAAWAKAAARERPAVVKVLDIDDIIAIKRRSPGARRNDSPWNDEAIGFPAMAEKSAKRRLARAMPLNVCQLAARMDEAFEEQGLVAHITPASGVVIDTPPAGPQSAAADLTAQQPAPQLDLGPGSDLPTATDRLAEYDRELTRRAEEGMKSLEAYWATMPREYRINLKSALDRRHKPAARRADEGKTP
jgi:recombination protein RecT